jgi:hypothetical protein
MVGSIDTYLSNGESLEVVFLERPSSDKEILDALIALALGLGGILFLGVSEDGQLGAINKPDDQYWVGKLGDLAKSVSHASVRVNGTRHKGQWIAHATVEPPLPEVVATVLPDLTASQRALILRLVPLVETGRHSSSLWASATFGQGWFVNLPGKDGGRTREITGFEELDLQALCDEGYITLMRKQGPLSYGVSLKPKATLEYRTCRNEVLSPTPLKQPLEQRDVFLCHAGEDKAGIVEPLIIALREVGVSYWYDREQIVWGESLTARVNDGLRKSRFVIPILSQSFVGKPWPERELNSVLSIEASSGEVRLLPLVVGSAEQVGAILAAYPLLTDKLYLQWDDDATYVAEAVRARLDPPAS